MDDPLTMLFASLGGAAANIAIAEINRSRQMAGMAALDEAERMATKQRLRVAIANDAQLKNARVDFIELWRRQQEKLAQPEGTP